MTDVPTTSEAHAMSGLDRARAMIAGTVTMPMEQTLGFALIEAENGRAVFRGTPGAHVLNPMGIVHGGYTASILDSACGIAFLTTLTEAQRFATLELKTAFHKAIEAGAGPVRAEATVLTRGRRVGFVEARLTDSTGRLLASATSTLMAV